VVEHPAAFDIARVQDRADDRAWVLETREAGERIELPDAGAFTVPEGTRISVAHGPVGSHASAALRLVLRGREVGSWDASARVAMVSEGADYLSAPYDQGAQDSAGYLAHGFQVRVTGVSGDTGLMDTGDSGEVGDGPGDTGEEKPGGCGCGGGAPAGMWLALLGLGVARRRR
jgi:uncharacterized protein (TIGR03382 family)